MRVFPPVQQIPPLFIVKYFSWLKLNIELTSLNPCQNNSRYFYWLVKTESKWNEDWVSHLNWLHRKRDGIHFRFLWIKIKLNKNNERNHLTKSNIVRKVPAINTFIVKEHSGTVLCFGCNAGRWRTAPPRRAFISAGSRFGARSAVTRAVIAWEKPAPRASYASVRVRGPSVRSHVCVSARAFVPHDKTQTEPASHSVAMTQAKKGALWAGGETPFEIWLK